MKTGALYGCVEDEIRRVLVECPWSARGMKVEEEEVWKEALKSSTLNNFHCEVV